MNTQEIDTFIEQILKEKGIVGLDPEVLEDVKTDMRNRLLDQIDKAAVMQLSEEKADELVKLSEDPDFTNEKMVEFMQNSGVDLASVALDTMLKFRNFYLGSEE